MADFTPKPKAEGLFKPENKQVKFNKVWGGHTFSDDEIATLLDGDPIEFDATSQRTGKDWHAKGTLEEQEFNGHKFWGFKPDFD